MPLEDFLTPPTNPLGEAMRLMRQPHQSEVAFFRANPKTTGYAAPDGRIVLNPFSTLSEQEKQSVMMNEFYRLKMRNPMVPKPPRATPGQLEMLQGYGTPQDISQTAVSRLMTGDPSGGQPSFAQQGYMDWLRNK